MIMKNLVQKVGVVIPIYNTSEEFFNVLKALENQTYPIARVVLVDSSPMKSPWNFQELAQDSCCNYKCLYICILPEEYDHGKTRNLGISKLVDVDAVLFLTQDAIMSKDCVEKLVNFLNRNSLAGVYARQLPRENATELEVIERKLMYPPTSRINVGIPSKIDDVLLSNACSMIRIDALNAVDGFPNKIITAEDIVLAYKLLSAGYKTGYCAEATLRHSHNLKFIGTVKRYFDTGVMHNEWKDEIPFNTARGKGVRLVKDEARFILRNKPSEIVSLVFSLAGKVIGYSLGRKHALLSIKLKRKLSQNKNFWKEETYN